MKTFKAYITENKNTHMIHLDDLAIYGGVDGARNAINALRSIRDMLSSKTGNVKVTTKWDGAPAVFAGIDPEDGQFFVAKKGIFNKNPKVYKTEQDIDDDISSAELNSKMKASLKYLSKLGIKGVVQGDLMFTKDDLKKETIDGENYIVFHPNTIAYAVPEKSVLGKKILKSEIGIVFHTSYSGKTFADMKASFNVKTKSFKTPRDVWYTSADIPSVSDSALMTKEETEIVTKHLSNAGKIFHKIQSTTLKDISMHPKLAQMIETFNNTFVRKGQIVINTSKHVEDLIKWIEARYQKDIDKLKTEKGKNKKSAEMAEFLSFFNRSNKASLKSLFDFQKELVMAKLILIKRLSKLNDMNKFIKTKDGYKVSDDEGFVAVDQLSNSAVKLVDRLSFSHNNFSPDVVKGWQKV